MRNEYKQKIERKLIKLTRTKIVSQIYIIMNACVARTGVKKIVLFPNHTNILLCMYYIVISIIIVMEGLNEVYTFNDYYNDVNYPFLIGL